MTEPAERLQGDDGLARAWLEDKAQGQRTPIEHSLTIGRSRQNQLRLEHESVSRFHAIIQAQGEGEFVLIDLGGVNGTFLQEQRLRHPIALQDGQLVRFGEVSFLFRRRKDRDLPGSRPTAVTKAPATTSLPPADRWILVSDIIRFTHFSRNNAVDDVARAVGSWMNEARTRLIGHNAILNKYLGDGFLAYWPDPATAPAQVAALIRSFEELRERCGLPFRTVVHHGPVLIDHRIPANEESLMGPDVIFLFRMEKLAAGLELPWLFSAAASAQLESHIPLNSTGPQAVSGFDETPSVFYTLGGG